MLGNVPYEYVTKINMLQPNKLIIISLYPQKEDTLGTIMNQLSIVLNFLICTSV